MWLVRGGTVTWPGWATMGHGFTRPGSRYAPDLTSDPIHPGPRLGSWAAFGHVAGREPGVAWWRVYFPHWIIPVGASILPLRWWVLYRGRWRGELRWGRGHCCKCGYDLRATPGRCPECGTAAAGKAV